MMKNKLFYILGITSAVLSSCSDDDVADMFLNGNEKTPLPVSVSLNAGSGVQTRAADKSFAVNDELLVYIQHVKDGSNSTIEAVDADMAPALVKFQVTSKEMTPVDQNTQQTSNLKLLSILHKGTGTELMQADQTTLYWDDFSDSRTEGTDLRTSGHGLRPLYGYCYNGGTPTTALDPTAGTLGWTVSVDQTDSIKTSDLLWSGTPGTYVEYNHEPSQRLGLNIPYTHAMSKVTIVLVAGAGFVADDLATSKVTLASMNTTCTVNAANSTLGKEQITNYNADGTVKDVVMYRHSKNGTLAVDAETTRPTRTFEAVVVPNKEWGKDNKIAVIEGMDGNTYNIIATESIIKQFLNKQTLTAEDKVIFEPGKNYKLTITLDKQPQDIVAQITNWTDVSASGKGEIKFNADITSHDKENQINTDGASIALWRKATVAEFTGARTTTATFDNDNDSDETEDTWVCDPTLYWPDGVTPYHFRALAKYDAATATKYEAFSGEGGEDDDFKVKQGSDIVWATTAAHTGTYKDADGTTKTKEYGEGDPIYPRTGTVPMAFEHAMSKISVSLDGGTAGADMVNVTGAKISILNIYDGGTISLVDGSIAASTLTASAAAPIKDYLPANDNESTGKKLSEVVVVPQSLLTMANGTARSGAVKFYDQNDLTTIYTNGTSIGTEEGTTYVTSTLDPVNYTADQAQEYNAALAGHVTAGDAIYYTYEEYKDLQPNAGISVSDFEYLSEEQKVKTPAVTYTLAECDEENSKHLVADENGKNPGDDGYDTTYPGDYTPLTESSVKTPAVLYEYEEYKALKPYAEMTKDQFDALDAADKKKGEYTAETAAAFNATLPGAKSTSDFHHYKPKDGDASIKANPGDVKLSGENPKVVLHILLADGTTYTLDLASCTPHVNDDENEDIAWERGKHYNYEISLRKEDITFRALVKDWVEKTTSGNATLEWD